MNSNLIIGIITILMGLIFLVGSLFYNKKKHEKGKENPSYGNYSDSFIASIIGGIFGIFLELTPWWISKVFIFLIGAGLIYLGILILR